MVVIVKYPCKQVELNMVARIGWSSFKTYNDTFKNKKVLYKPPYYDGRIAEVDVAEKFDDYMVRKAKVTLKRIEMEKKQVLCINKWQELKSHAETAWEDDEEVLKAKCQEAGASYYAAAAGRNWESVKDLMKTGETFIAENTTALTDGENMPPAFVSEFTDLRKDFDNAASAFYAEEDNDKVIGDKKIAAYNLVYKKLMNMFADGQKYFRDDESVKQQFVFESVLQLVSNKLASLKGHITTDVINDKLDGFELRILENDEEVVSDAEGRYDFGSLAAGKYTVIAGKDGYATQTIANVEVVTGTAKILNIVMQKV